MSCLHEAVNVTSANEPPSFSLVDKPETNELAEAVNVTSANEPPRSSLVDKPNSPTQPACEGLDSKTPHATPTLAFVAPQESGQEHLQTPSSLPMPNQSSSELPTDDASQPSSSPFLGKR